MRHRILLINQKRSHATSCCASYIPCACGFDWYPSRQISLSVVMEDCVVDFPSTICIDGVSVKPCASYMSEDLVSRRSIIKRQIEVWEGQMEVMEEGVELENARLDHISMDTTQYVMKIFANSGDGAMSFSLYNSYSPRCGFSVTAAARYCLQLSITVIKRPGYSVSYLHL